MQLLALSKRTVDEVAHEDLHVLHALLPQLALLAVAGGGGRECVLLLLRLLVGRRASSEPRPRCGRARFLLAGRRGERVEREQQVQQQRAAQAGAEGRAVVRQQSRRTRHQLEQRRKRWELEQDLRAHTSHQVQYTISSVYK